MIKTKIPVKYNQRNPQLEAKVLIDIVDYRYDIQREEIVLTVHDYAIITHDIEDEDNPELTKTIETKTFIDKKLYRLSFDEVEQLKQVVYSTFDFQATTESERKQLIQYGLFIITTSDSVPIYDCPSDKWEMV